MMLFINKMFLLFNFKIQFYMKNVHFQLFFVVVKMTGRRKNQSEEWTSLFYLFTL